MTHAYLTSPIICVERTDRNSRSIRTVGQISKVPWTLHLPLASPIGQQCGLCPVPKPQRSFEAFAELLSISAE